MARLGESDSLLFSYLIIYTADKRLPANPANREYIFDETDHKGQGSALYWAAASHSRGGSIDVVIWCRDAARFHSGRFRESHPVFAAQI